VSKSKGILNFLFSRAFLIQVVLAGFVLGGILYGTLLYLDKITLHGEEITVPDLMGINKNNLGDFLEEKNLRFIIIDSSFVGDKGKGIVISQNPVALSKVKKDRTIYITANAMKPPRVKLPVLVDKSLRQAKSMIENIGLVLGELIYRPDYRKNCVLAQKLGDLELERDTFLPKGTIIDLVIGGGISDEKVLVPKLLNLTREEAIERLYASYLNIGIQIYDGSVFDKDDSIEAKIFSQSPPYSATSWLPMGSSVDVEYTSLYNNIDSTIVIDSSIYRNIAADSTN